MSARPHILLATLGGQPQVVTFTLDLLLKDFPISDVVVLHPTATTEKLQRSLQQLRAEFIDDYYQAAGRVIHLRSHVLRMNGQPLDDIVDDPSTDATLETIHQLIIDLKRQGYHIHLSITGGRRLMALLAISVASLNFDRHDHIWHIHTPEATAAQVNNGEQMHVSPAAGVKLIRGPFITLGAYISPGNSSFKTAEQEQQDLLDQQERKRCQQVIQHATARQLDVLKAFARGIRTAQVASELCISEPTVHSHKGQLLLYCRNIWNIPEPEPLDYHFISQKFGNYFDSDG